MKNTFLAMLRPGMNEQENNEQKVEMPNKMEERKATMSVQEQYPSVNYDYLNSEVFTNEGNNVRIAEPRNFEDAEIIVEAIKAGKTVLIFLDSLKEKGMDSRVLDFVSGYCHAFGIQPQKTKQEHLWVVDPQHKRTKTSFR